MARASVYRHESQNGNPYRENHVIEFANVRIWRSRWGNARTESNFDGTRAYAEK